jgi:hypothetical protein
MSKERGDFDLVTVKIKHGMPSLRDVADEIGVELDALDEIYGVVPVDPGRSLFAVRLKRGLAHKADRNGAEEFSGPWAEPSIKPFDTK